MKKIAIASLITVFCALTCAFVAGTVSAQGGWEKTITLPSGEKVLDMRGEWDIYHEFLERLKWVDKPSSDILLITQEGTTFSAVQQIGTKKGTPKGTEKFKGVLDKNGFKEVQYYGRPHLGMKLTWIPCTCESISENGNKIVFVDTDRHRWTFTRR